jgi:hypothetical protein
MWVFGSCLPLSAPVSWDELSAGDVSEPSARAGWSAAARSYPAFAVSQFDFPEKTETYRIFRHPRRWPQGRLFAGQLKTKSRLQGPKSIAVAAADRAHRRKRTETGGIIRPRRTGARQLRCISHIRRVDGLGELWGKPWAARHALIRRRPRCWFSCKFFSGCIIIVMQCGRIDLVTKGRRRLN